MSSFWSLVGVLLLAWVGWDLYAGYTILWDVVYREVEPTKYWMVLGGWTVLAISCFFSWSSEEE